MRIVCKFLGIAEFLEMERVQPPCSRIVGVRDKIRIVIFVNYARIQNCGTALPIRDSIYSISSNYRKILFTIPLNSLVNLIRIFKLLDGLLNRRFDINMYLFKYRTLNLKRRKLIFRTKYPLLHSRFFVAKLSLNTMIKTLR